MDNTYTKFPKGVVGDMARDRVERPRNLQLKATVTFELEPTMRSSNARMSQTKRGRNSRK